MNEDIRLEDNILRWINSFSDIDAFVASFIELGDGQVLIKILSKVDVKLWDYKKVKSAESKDPRFKLFNLRYIFKGIQKFYETQ
jgi:hypothetical protein